VLKVYAIFKDKKESSMNAKMITLAILLVSLFTWASDTGKTALAAETSVQMTVPDCQV
jgi:D-Tyr-tRNAtyr deacylase